MSSREDQQLEVSEMGVNRPGQLRGCSLRVRRGRWYFRTGRGHCVKCRPWARDCWRSSRGQCGGPRPAGVGRRDTRKKRREWMMLQCPRKPIPPPYMALGREGCNRMPRRIYGRWV